MDDACQVRNGAVLAAQISTWLRDEEANVSAAASRRHCQRPTIPEPHRTTGPAISQDQRWTLTARLLHDTTLEPTDGVAGCLLLLYAPRPGSGPRSALAPGLASGQTRTSGAYWPPCGRYGAAAA